MAKPDRLVDLLFRRMDLCRKPGSDMSAHMPTLYALARIHSFGEIVECGTSEGFSTHALLCGALEGGSRLTSFDVNAGCGPHVRRELGLEGDPQGDRWRFFAKSSVKAAEEWDGGPVGLFFLDTSHRLQYTRDELAAWLPRMHPDGAICGHDYLLHLVPGWETKCGVKTAVDEFAQRHADRFRLQTVPYDQGLFILWPR